MVQIVVDLQAVLWQLEIQRHSSAAAEYIHELPEMDRQQALNGPQERCFAAHPRDQFDHGLLHSLPKDPSERSSPAMAAFRPSRIFCRLRMVA